MIKGSRQQVDICTQHAAAAKSLQLCPTLCNPIDIGVRKYIKQILTNKRGEIESNTTTIGFLTIHLHY